MRGHGFLVDVDGHALARQEHVLPCPVDFDTVSTAGLESSPVAAVLEGLQANEARYFTASFDFCLARSERPIGYP